MALISLFKNAVGKFLKDTTDGAALSESAEVNGNSVSPGESEVKMCQESPALTEENGPGEESLPGNEGPSGKESEAVIRPECSIYEYIKKHTKDGRIPPDFRIPWIQGEWAPGAQDGVFLYHTAPVQPDPAREQKILEALTLMSDEENGQYIGKIFAIFEEIEEKSSIVKLFDEINRIIALHQAELNLENLLNFGDWLICSGVSLLSVKLGLTVIAGFHVPFVEEVMTEFGVYDEFTYYAARVLSNKIWENGNEELFRLAGNVRGWGRIHAVAYLRPETQEIRDWLLYEGADNDIIFQYSANTCLQKSGAESRLDSALSAGEFEAIGKLIQTALEPGPCPGITAGERILPKFLERGREFPIDPALRQMIAAQMPPA